MGEGEGGGRGKWQSSQSGTLHVRHKVNKVRLTCLPGLGRVGVEAAKLSSQVNCLLDEVRLGQHVSL